METKTKRADSCSKPHGNGPPEIELATGQVVMGLPDMPMKRKFSILSIIAVGYNISNSWVAIATSFAIAVQSGGAVSLLYGIVAVIVAMLCTGVTLAELASVYPTAGGQYHFTSILASERWSRSLSYFNGLAAVFSWITLAASIAVASTQALMAVVIRWQPEYVPQAWHYFLVYQLFNTIMVVYNIFLTNRTLWVYNAGCTYPLPSYLAIPGIYKCMLTSSSNSHPLPWNLPRHHHHLSRPLPHRDRLLRHLDAVHQRLRRLAQRHLLPDRPLHAAVHALRARRHPPPSRRVSRAEAYRPQGRAGNRRSRLSHCVPLFHCYHLQLSRRGIIPVLANRVRDCPSPP